MLVFIFYEKNDDVFLFILYSKYFKVSIVQICEFKQFPLHSEIESCVGKNKKRVRSLGEHDNPTLLLIILLL